MNETQKESLSALFDGETTEFETRRLLAELDDESRLKWQRYQLIRDSAANKLNGCNFTIDIAAKVSAQIENEPLIQSVMTEKSKNESWLKPFVGFAVAASVAFVTVFSWQNMQQESNSSSAGFLANGNVSASQLQISGGLGLNQVNGTATVVLSEDLKNIDEQKLKNKERLQYYMKLHSQNASSNNGQGLIPLSRITPEDK